MPPAMVFGECCGFPMEDAARFDQWVDDIVFARSDDESVARAAADEVYDYFRSLIALRRREPGHDVISALLRADHGGRPLHDETRHGPWLMSRGSRRRPRSSCVNCHRCGPWRGPSRPTPRSLG